MTLTDAGPLVALINGADQGHTLCVQTSKLLPESPLLTTWPCFTEAMHLLYRDVGTSAQADLWRWREDASLTFYELTSQDADYMADLMAKYADLPMDLADASLIAAAEALRERRIFTIDQHFHVYRFADGGAVDVVP